MLLYCKFAIPFFNVDLSRFLPFFFIFFFQSVLTWMGDNWTLRVSVTTENACATHAIKAWQFHSSLGIDDNITSHMKCDMIIRLF